MSMLSRAVVLAAFVACAAALPLSADAAVVKILTSTLASSIAGADADDDLNAFYDALGAISSLHTGTIAAADLIGVDLLVVMLPDDAFSPAEITAIDDFVANGGELLLMGEQDDFAMAENGHLNGLLVGLGSSMSLDAASLDPGFNDTVPSQILAQPGLTDGVLTVNYGNINSISGADPGRRIFLASNLSSVWGAFELIEQSRIVLLGDVNVISNLEDTVGNDNHTFFANLVGIETQNTAVKILTSILAGAIASGDGDNDLNAFYQAKGITSSLWPNEVSSEALAGAQLLVVMLPDDAFTTAELAALDDFLVAGGRLLFMGEQETFAATENAHINAALASLGSALSLSSDSLDATGLQDTVTGQVLTHPFTTGISVLNYGNVNSISGVPAGGGLDGPLFLAKDLTSVWGAVEDLPTGGTVVLVADVNLVSNLEDEIGNDNHLFFLNIAPAPASPVPALGIGSWGLGILLGATGARFAGLRAKSRSRARRA